MFTSPSVTHNLPEDSLPFNHKGNSNSNSNNNYYDVAAKSLAPAGVPVSKEPSGLSRSDGKRPDGLTLIPWRAGRSLIWDVTMSCTTADSYLEASSRGAGAAAELAASNKVVKYAGLSSQGEFVPIAVESHGPINRDAHQFCSVGGEWRRPGMFEHLRFYS